MRKSDRILLAGFLVVVALGAGFAVMSWPVEQCSTVATKSDPHPAKARIAFPTAFL
jgi:hypothetical protein